MGAEAPWWRLTREERRSEMKKIMRLMCVHVADTSDGYVQLFKLFFVHELIFVMPKKILSKPFNSYVGHVLYSTGNL